MNKIVNYENKYFFLIALILSLLLVTLKWILSYLYFDEDIILRIINDSSDTTYYPIIKAFSELNFSPSYSDSLDNLKMISFPALSLFINSFFFKIFGNYSFIILEIICSAFFILIFYKIFIKLKFSNIFSILCSILLFTLPTLLVDLAFIKIEILDNLRVNLQKFYSLRFPRPIISNLFFFSFIYFALDFYLKKENYNRNLLILSILMGITINALFYLFFIELFLFIIIFLLKFKKIFLNYILQNIKIFFSSLIIFLSFVLVFQFQMYYSEPDYIERLGVFHLNPNQKIILIDYLKHFFLGKKFIFLFLFNTLFFFIIKDKPFRFFYFTFVSSILSTIFFCFIFNKGVDYYHFFDWIVITGFLYPLISCLYFFESIFCKSFQINNYNNLIKIFLVLLVIYFNVSNGLKFQNKLNLTINERAKEAEVANFINQSDFFKDKNLEIFNFNYKISNWLILNNFKNFSLIPSSFWTPKKNATLEDELISSLNFLNFDKVDFYKIIKNKEKSWRFKNEFVYIFFGRKYLANSLVSFNNNLFDFEKIEQKYISSNNLLITHQVIIPKSEIQRLLNKFDETKTKKDPDVVILDKDGYLKINELKNIDYCLIFNNDFFKIYIRLKKIDECKLFKS